MFESVSEMIGNSVITPNQNLLNHFSYNLIQQFKGQYLNPIF